MVIQPDSTITLYSGVDIGTDMQLAFSSRTKQTAYFTSKVKKAYVNCTTVKDKIGVVRVTIKPVGQAGTGEITGADLASCNYMSFVNPSFDNKTIYCYIVDYKYLNNETAEISYMIDYWQTWLFDVDFHDMYIDREHLSVADWTKIEANPYDTTVPQMITQEPLPIAKGYEKPIYDIAWFNNSDNKDGKAILTSQVIDDANDMVHGSWSYWNVMLIQAPTDWDKFATEDTYTYLVGDCCYRDIIVDDEPFRQAYYCSTSTHGGDFDPNDWLEITIANADPNTGMIINNPYQRTYSVPGGSGLDRFVVGANMHIYMNTAATTQTFDVDDPTGNSNFQDNGIYDQYSRSAALRELNDILELYDIKIIPAGSTISLDQQYVWSAKPHGCDVLVITNSEAWQSLATFYSKYNAVSQIVALYGVPKSLWDAGTIDKTAILPSLDNMDNCDNYEFSVSAMRTSISDTGVQVSVRNKKLYTAPFSYFRVISPTGDIKEYDYGLFKNITSAATLSSSDKITFKIVSDISGDSPKIYMIPVGYKVNNIVNPVVEAGVNSANSGEGYTSRIGTAMANTMKCNLDEAICVEGFPQVSFNTDGYLTFLASEYAMTLANYTSANKLDLDIMNYNTDLNRNQLPAVIGAVGSTTKGAIGGALSGGVPGAVIGGVVGASQGAYNIFDTIKTSELNRQAYHNVREKYSEANAWASGSLLSTDDPNVDRFNSCKPAYANNAYVGGTGGVIRYLRGMGLFDFVGIHVQLRPEILEYYDKWFDQYGYTSCRCGIPYVIQWCRSSTGDTYASTHVDPHWVASGELADTTYIKTKDCKVEHSMMPVANAIKDMFDKGVRLKKGDLS